MAQGEQGGGGEPPQGPGGTEPGAGRPRVGPSPGALQAAREQAERSRAAAEERERRLAARPEPQPSQPFFQYPPEPPHASADAQGAPPPAGQGWPAWQARPSQPGHQQPSQPAHEQPPAHEQRPSQPGYVQQPPQPAGYVQHPPAPYQQQPSYPAYGQPAYGQTPYGYAPAPYPQAPPGAWPQPAAAQATVKAPPDEHPKELPWRLAGWWSRVGAQVIDLLIVWVPWAAVLTTLILLADGARNGSGAETALIVVAIVATFAAWATHLFYAPLLMKRKGGRNGQTWGKQLCNIRVIRADGNAMRFSDAALRQIIYKSFGMLVASTFVPLFPWILNYLWPTWDEQHRALHDLAADTRVVAA